MTPFQDIAVARAFDGFPPGVRRKMLALRELIFHIAASVGAGPIEETLKLGEPAYLTPRTKPGSEIRMGWTQSRPAEYALYFHCQASLVESFRAEFSGELKFEGSRAIVFEESEAWKARQVAQCIAAALTHDSRKAT